MKIYVLLLQQNKYYVGKTNHIINRITGHCTNRGSLWTKIHKPIKILQIYDSNNVFDEDKYTIKYMKQYGIDNVRGGSFCQIELNEENTNTINRMINGSTDKCYKCGGNHFAITK